LEHSRILWRLTRGKIFAMEDCRTISSWQSRVI
jgi:hypothetical protein